MRTEDLDFELPAELIAQAPVENRAHSRLLHYRRCDGSIEHRRFAELASLLRPGDLLVFNDAKVVPARFTLRKRTGGLIEGLYLSNEADGTWRVLLRNLGPRAIGKVLAFEDAPEVPVNILEQGEEGQYRIAVGSAAPALELLARVGRMPLPPYIKRGRHHDPRDAADHQRYQTVYARIPGSGAAPTAGLHFTDALLRELDEKGVQRVFVTLHVGLGTFKPVASDTLEGHVMHTEAYSIGQDAAEALNRANRDGRRIIAVGTTSARVIESQPADAPFVPKHDQTDIFIYPPYAWKHVAAMITNFHLPRSTLIALVAAMVGLDEQRRIYRTAIEQRYRFFSYGDAMFIE
jgi:S-adenosylmethionine:tRNA ribosyltransferase-isomerase